MNNTIDLYFNWLKAIVYKGSLEPVINYDKVLTDLFNTPFIFSIPLDINRQYDGLSLRTTFTDAYRLNESDIDIPCTVLEMMIALAIRCENSIMYSTSCGDRTSQWFWTMIKSLGLSVYINENYDEVAVKTIIDNFLNRKYEPNGSGGLFTVRMPDCDMRNIEIWVQLMWYLDELEAD